MEVKLIKPEKKFEPVTVQVVFESFSELEFIEEGKIYSFQTNKLIFEMRKALREAGY